MDNENKTPTLDDMLRMAEVMNDTPVYLTIGGERYGIKALKMGTQALIAEESCRIQKNEEGNLADIIKHFAESVPAVIRCLAYAVLNDKNRIFSDYEKREYSDEYKALVDKLEWESKPTEWLNVLVSVIRKLDIGFFFDCTQQMTLLRETILSKRKKAAHS